MTKADVIHICCGLIFIVYSFQRDLAVLLDTASDSEEGFGVYY